MGMNLYSCCHKCQVKVFHFRGKENKTLIPFYHLHGNCLRRDSGLVKTVSDSSQWKEWMQDEGLGGYRNQWEYDQGKQEYIMPEFPNPPEPIAIVEQI